MSIPPKIYRYRPLSDELLARELDAVRQSYLYSPSFKAMNDPMEALIEFGGSFDHLIDLAMKRPGQNKKNVISLKKCVDDFGLISFSESHKHLPLWAYYATNFFGMCLEFDSIELGIGGLQNEELRKVEYEINPLPPLDWQVHGFKDNSLKESICARLSRKRVEWAHEKEWRFITGQVGRRYYLDDALKRVFLGPRINAEHAKKICKAFSRRPVEVLKGEVSGFQLEFRIIQPACRLNKCERLGRGIFDVKEISQSEEELQSFLAVPFQRLVDECHRIAGRPNVDKIFNVGISTNDRELLYIQAVYKFRDGAPVYHRSYFDRHLRLQAN